MSFRAEIDDMLYTFRNYVASSGPTTISAVLDYDDARNILQDLIFLAPDLVIGLKYDVHQNIAIFFSLNLYEPFWFAFYE